MRKPNSLQGLWRGKTSAPIVFFTVFGTFRPNLLRARRHALAASPVFTFEST